MGDTGWFKSTRSTGGGDNCVEVRITDTATGVRDSKNPHGGQLILSPPAFATFLESVTADR
jgi:hypothetical protein